MLNCTSILLPCSKAILTSLFGRNSKALDYFNFNLGKDDKFSLAYDYTFLCALPIELRTSWGERYAELVRPGGCLVALMYPIRTLSRSPSLVF